MGTCCQNNYRSPDANLALGESPTMNDGSGPSSKKYAYFRSDIKIEEGHTPELISCDYELFEESTNLDDMRCLPHNGEVATLL